MTNKERALLVAEKAHHNQSYDIYPYMYHVKQVIKIAEELGYDESITIGCTLHDTMEDGTISYNKIKKHFGKEIAEIVILVTDERGRDRIEKHSKTYPDLAKNWKAVVVKVCDRIANMEHSYKYDKGLFNMYYNESNKFKDILYSEKDIETHRVWSKYDDLLANKKIII